MESINVNIVSGANAFEIVFGLATAFIALTVAIVSVRQYRVERMKLRHDLFDRRFAVFKTAQLFVSKVIQDAELPADEYTDFVDAWQRSRFLFGNDVSDYLDELRKRSLKIRYGKMKESTAALTWVTEQPTILFDKFIPYLKVRD